MGCSGSRASKIKEEHVTKSQVANELKIYTHNLVGENKDALFKTYKLLDKLGEGTFGKVYKALHIPSGQLRALKRVSKNALKYQDDTREFLKEIEVLSKLDHPNIIKVFEYFVDKGYYYVVTELANGGELFDQIFERESYDEKDAAVVLKQVLSAVTFLHSNGIVHRDLKPENLLLETNIEGDLSIKLIDFGAANIYSIDGKTTRMTMKIGTPYYIAPEVLSNNYDNKCDIWSAGIILYILLCGYPPFDGKNDKEIMDSVQHGKLEFDPEAWADISHEAKTLVSKMLNRDTNARLTAEQALHDPWIVKNSKSKGVDHQALPKLSVQTLQKFTSKQKLQQASIAFLIHQISTNKKVKDLRTIFQQLDQTGDGRLSHDELKGGYQKFFSDSLTEEEFADLCVKLDQDKSGFIEYEEFLRATVDLDSILTEKNLHYAFNFFDKDGSGKLSVEEVKIVLGVINDDKDGGEIVRKIIAEVDTNGDGEINFNEFKVLMKNNAESNTV